MLRFSANLEWMYTETDDLGERVARAAADGFTEVEIWSWRDKDIEALADALRSNEVSLLSLIVDPQLPLTDPATREEFLRAVDESVTVAQRLSAPALVVVAGPDLPGVPLGAQRSALVSALAAAAERVPDGITLLLEPLNDRVDHPGTFLTSTAEGLDIVDEVGSPRLALLLDVYHALMMGESIDREVGDRWSSVAHVQIADVPGRHEPGSGGVDWAEQLRHIAAGYSGTIGLEYMPTADTTSSFAEIRGIGHHVG